jgi:hypothetical protein
MDITAAFRRHGAPLAVVAGIAMFAGALGGLTGIDRRLQADITSQPGVDTPGPNGAPGPARVSEGPAGRDCPGGGRRRDGGGDAHSPHDGRKL